METRVGKSVLASSLKVGMWTVGSRPSMNQRIVDVSRTRDGQVRLEVDYGSGGEPGLMFLDVDERILVN